MKQFIYALLTVSYFTASNSFAIVGGKLVAENDSIALSTVGVVMTSRQGTAICTGSLLPNSQVLTAGHCAMGGDKVFIVFSTNIMNSINSPMKVRQVVKRWVDPSYYRMTVGANDQPDVSDVAILTFAGYAPTNYVPAKVMTKALAQVALRDEGRITLAGYGATDYYARQGSGVLRQIKTKIDKFYVSGKSVKVGTSAHGACHGDSGGPALVNYQGQDYVFAVTSRSTDPQGACTGRATYSLVF